ncbi:MAG: HvfC family RiPP maturation protein [bacterium]
MASLAEQQLSFASHLRDPEHHPAPTDVEDRRMAIYRELFYNNISEFVTNGFPVLNTITPEDVQQRRIRAFFNEHHCQTPYFPEISAEYVEWLRNERGDHPDDPPFIVELAHYEWVEFVLAFSDADEDLPPVDHNGDIIAGVPVVSPVAWHLSYQYPVHLISEDYQPEEPGEQPTYLLVYRDRLDEIHFLEINPVTYRLLDLLSKDAAMTGQQALEHIANELQHPDPAAVITHGRTLLEDLRERNIIIGTLAEVQTGPA